MKLRRLPNWLQAISAVVVILIFLTGYSSIPQALVYIGGLLKSQDANQARAAAQEVPLACNLYSTTGPNHDVDLYWDASNATEGSIDHGVGSLSDAVGHETVHNVFRATTFTATFKSSVTDAIVRCSTTVNASTKSRIRVAGSDAEPTCELHASPSALAQPGDIILIWDSSNATSGLVENGDVAVQLSSASGYVPFYDIRRTTSFIATFTSYPSGKFTRCFASVTVMSKPHLKQG